MIVVPDMVLKNLMTNLVEATHGLADHRGNRHRVGTISEKELRMAALNALNQILGEVAWPSDQKIILPAPRINAGIFQQEE